MNSTGDLTLGGRITFENSEFIDNEADDYIGVTGAGGSDNTDFFLDLDGTYPIVFSSTDTKVGIDDDLEFVGAQTISTSTGNLTIDTAGTLVVSDTLSQDGTLSVQGQFTLGDNGDTGAVNTSDWDISTTGAMTGIGAITMDGNLTFANSEVIDNVTDDYLGFSGAGGYDNPAFFLDLDGTYPIVFSSTDTKVGIDDDLEFVGAQTISTSTGNLTIDTAGTLVVSDTLSQ